MNEQRKIFFSGNVNLYQRAMALIGSWHFCAQVVSKENAIIISNGKDNFTAEQKVFLEEIKGQVIVEELLDE